MKIAIDIGHNCYPDTGANSIGNEDSMVKNVGNRLILKLQALGHQVLLVTPTSASSVIDSLAQRVEKANLWGADQYVSIHANAGGGHGTEVWIGSSSSRDIATQIVNNIAATGYTNRGVKVQGIDGGHLYVLRYTNMKALLVEQCFVDSKDDMDKWDPEAMANAIVAGITGNAVQKLVVKYDENIPNGANIFPIPGTTGYIEQAEDGRLIVHKDRGNYIAIGKGVIQAFWNDNNGHSGSKKISD